MLVEQFWSDRAELRVWFSQLCSFCSAFYSRIHYPMNEICWIPMLSSLMLVWNKITQNTCNIEHQVTELNKRNEEITTLQNVYLTLQWNHPNEFNCQVGCEYVNNQRDYCLEHAESLLWRFYAHRCSMSLFVVFCTPNKMYGVGCVRESVAQYLCSKDFVGWSLLHQCTFSGHWIQYWFTINGRTVHLGFWSLIS